MVAANNDCSVRIFDIEYFDLLKHHVFPWSVNVSSLSILVYPLGYVPSFVSQVSDFSFQSERFGEPKRGTVCCPWGP